MNFSQKVMNSNETLKMNLISQCHKKKIQYIRKEHSYSLITFKIPQSHS